MASEPGLADVPQSGEQVKDWLATLLAGPQSVLRHSSNELLLELMGSQPEIEGISYTSVQRGANGTSCAFLFSRHTNRCHTTSKIRMTVNRGLPIHQLAFPTVLRKS